MASYIDIQFDLDQDSLADAAVQHMQDNVPGWEPSAGHVETFLFESVSRITSELAFVVSQVPASVFRAYGITLNGILPGAGSRSTVATTWTMQDADGYTVPAGTQVGYALTGDQTLLFQTTTDFTVVPGNTSTPAGSVILEAVEVGAVNNGVPAGPLALPAPLSFVSGVSATEVSSGGADEESDTDYLNRLSTELRLRTPRPILAQDFAVLAARIDGVHRALGISGYNPDTATFGNERYVTVALVDEDGAPVGSAVKADVSAYLESLREVNFVVKTMDPTFTTINVAYTVRVEEGANPTDTLAATDAAILAFISPGTFAGGNLSPAEWFTDYTKIRYLELAAAVASVDGVRYVQSLTVNSGTSDVTLTGVAPLPQPGTIAGTVA